jgi:hypothetical protein
MVSSLRELYRPGKPRAWLLRRTLHHLDHSSSWLVTYPEALRGKADRHFMLQAVVRSRLASEGVAQVQVCTGRNHSGQTLAFGYETGSPTPIPSKANCSRSQVKLDIGQTIVGEMTVLRHSFSMTNLAVFSLSSRR